MTRPYTAPAIRKAAEILQHLAERSVPVRLSDLSRELGFGKSTVHGILRSLEDVGWVERVSGNGSFRVGEQFLSLTRKAFGVRELVEFAHPLLEKLAERGGESAFLGFPRRDRVVIEACVEGRREMCISGRAGGWLPLFAAATGKVFLAGMSDDAARAALAEAPLPRFTDRSITDPDAFLVEVRKVREQGYGTDEEEYLRGVRAAAAPIRCGGETVAAMWVAGFATRLSDERLAGVLKELLASAASCSAWLDSGKWGS